jgi:hypothetical protein
MYKKTALRSSIRFDAALAPRKSFDAAPAPAVNQANFLKEKVKT